MDNENQNSTIISVYMHLSKYSLDILCKTSAMLHVINNTTLSQLLHNNVLQETHFAATLG